MRADYKAVFYDWDGTAVLSRKAPVEDVVAVMKPLLQKGIKLIIISGTTYENIAGGRLESYFTETELENLYLGLGRGAFNYRFENGKPVYLSNLLPSKEVLLRIHDMCYHMHRLLLEQYDYPTDVIFCRPNYCKIDIMVDNNRGDQLFMQENEIDLLRESLEKHGIHGGLRKLLELSREQGGKDGLVVKPTCDAKYLEIGLTDKSDNVEEIMKYLGLTAKECCFWGDEFLGAEPGIWGSDYKMYTGCSEGSDFYDVSPANGVRPENVQHLGGGVQTFLQFLGNMNVSN